MGLAKIYLVHMTGTPDRTLPVINVLVKLKLRGVSRLGL